MPPKTKPKRRPRSAIPRPLLQAYRDTTYKVRVAGRDVKLRIGRRCPGLDALLRRRRRAGGAFMTAWNPHSARATRIENDAANESLSQGLKDDGFEVLRAVGLGRDRSWEEPGMFVVGIGARAAARWARKYRQNAIVYLPAGRAARLVLLR